jgi:hypothetical protein
MVRKTLALRIGYL